MKEGKLIFIENYLENSDEQTNPPETAQYPNLLIMTFSIYDMSLFLCFTLLFLSLSQHTRGLILPLFGQSAYFLLTSVDIYQKWWCWRLSRSCCFSPWPTMLPCLSLSVLVWLLFISLDWQAVVFCCLIPACVLVISSHFFEVSAVSQILHVLYTLKKKI